MIIAINGKLRQGKGVLMTLIALLFAKQGGRVYSNYKINYPNCETIDFLGLIQFLMKGRQQGLNLVAIDEIQGWLDSRVSASKASRFGTYFLFQSAKLGYWVVYSSQVNMRADIDFRNLADLRFLAEKKEGYFKYSVLDNSYPDENVPTGRVLKIPFSVASKFWNLYDTFEAVPPVGLKDMLFEAQRMRF